MGDIDADADHRRRRPGSFSFLNRLWHPTPRPPAFGKGTIIPQASAGCVSSVSVWLDRPLGARTDGPLTSRAPTQALVASCALMALAADHGGLYAAPGERR